MKSKAQELAESLFRLQQDFSVYEVIAANSQRLEGCDYNKFLSYVFWRSQSSLIIRLCSIFEKEIEKEGAFSLSSISGVRKCITNGELSISEQLLPEFLEKFPCEDSKITDPTQKFLYSATQFGIKKKQVIKELKHYRDTQLAHHQSGIIIDGLPSFDEMYSLYEFAYSFCKVVVTKEGLYGFKDDYIVMNTKRSLAKLSDTDLADLESRLK